MLNILIEKAYRAWYSLEASYFCPYIRGKPKSTVPPRLKGGEAQGIQRGGEGSIFRLIVILIRLIYSSVEN
jgi:hypothetical protein